MVKKLTSYFREYRIFALLTPIFLIIEVMMEVFIPKLMSKIVDDGIGNGDASYVVKFGMIMIGMAIIGLICGVLGANLSAKAGTGFAKNLRAGLLDKVQEFSFSNTDKFSTASLLTRLTTDVINTQNAFITTLRMAGRSPIMLVAAVIMSLSINKKITLVFLLAIPVILLVFGIVSKKAMPKFQAMLAEYDNLNSMTQENISGIRVVKSFVRGDHEEEKFNTVANNVRTAQQRAEYLLVAAMPMMQVIMYSCLIAIFWFGGNMMIRSELKVGEFLSLFTYVIQILMSLMMIAGVFMQVIVSRASMKRITEVLNEEVSIKDKPNAITSVPNGSIEFRNVSFCYSEGTKNALTDINLKINSGESVGIIGSTGSSKSTLVQLIPRLYDTTKGSVKVGGIDVKDYDLHALREEVAMVLQKNVLFSGTILDNLTWGNPDATREQVEAVAKVASAHEFIMSFPDGYDTWLDQGGVNLSGGQKQRLCIARALLKNPKVIIMDDSTSAVDTATDASIRQALNKELKGTTSIIITQRISSVMDSDKIVVMHKGQINGIGTHEELLKNNDIYRDIYVSQQRGVAS